MWLSDLVSVLQAQPLVEAPAAQPAPAAEPSTAIEPDLVQQALAETLPEVSAAITTESATPAPEPQAAVSPVICVNIMYCVSTLPSPARPPYLVVILTS